MIFHIVKKSEWNAAVQNGRYCPASVAAEGFIHCSTRAQLIETANRFYRGERDLIVLCIDENRSAAPVKFEAPSIARDGIAGHEDLSRESAGLFPHIHGELDVGAVVRVIEFPCGRDGGFSIPADLPPT